MEVVHLKVGAPLTVEGSRLEAATTPLHGLVQPTVYVELQIRFYTLIFPSHGFENFCKAS